MPEPHPPPELGTHGRVMIRTLAELAERYRVTAHCHAEGCLHQAELDLAQVMARLGPSFAFDQLRGRLHCQACGGRQVSIRLHGRPARRGWNSRRPER